MHNKVQFIVVSSLLMPYLLAAPIHDDFRRPLIVARTVPVAANTFAVQVPRLVPVSAVKPALAWPSNELKFTAPLAPGSIKTSPWSATGGRTLCPYGQKGKDSFALCRSSLNPNTVDSANANLLLLHPDGKGGPGTGTTQVTVGKQIGSGFNQHIYQVASHNLPVGDQQDDLIATKYTMPWPYVQDEIKNHRDGGNIHASGTHDGHMWIVTNQVKGQDKQSSPTKPETSPNSQDWPSPTKLRGILKTQDHQATFWTGWRGSESAQVPAEAHAVSRDGKTLEMALHEGKAKMPVWTPGDEQANKKWTQAAKIFAQRARGDVHVHIGESVRPSNIYEVTEKPTLLQNENVNSITEHMHDGSKNVIVPERKRTIK